VTVILTMKGGKEHRLTGYASKISKQIDDARAHIAVGHPAKLLQLELDTVPTGKPLYVDPTEVASVKDDRW
jgi:hypothetical protein